MPVMHSNFTKTNQKKYFKQGVRDRYNVLINSISRYLCLQLSSYESLNWRQNPHALWLNHPTTTHYCEPHTIIYYIGAKPPSAYTDPRRLFFKKCLGLLC